MQPQWENANVCRKHPLLTLGHDSWLIRDAVEGTQVFGGTGSGKTSGSGKDIAKAFIQAGFGGLVLTAKPDDLATWVGYLRLAGLTDAQIRDRVVVVEPPGKRHPSAMWPRARGAAQGAKADLDLPICRQFNFLTYEFEKSGGLTQDLVSLFVNSMSGGGAAVSRTDPYWDDALRELLTHTIDLAYFGTLAAGNEKPAIRLEDLDAIIRSAPQSRAEAMSSAWRNQSKSLCWLFIENANERLAKTGALERRFGKGRLGDLEHTVGYWLNDFPSLAEKTRSIIVSSFTSKASGLLRSPLLELLCSEDASTDNAKATPELTHEEGKIVILNLPVKLYGEVGRFAQAIWKTIWQRATERRAKKLNDEWARQRPVFLWADESQNFITKEDALFQQTARASLAATVYLTQNISNYYAALGGDSSRAAADSFLGNLQTKIFHANGDPATNEWAGRLFGSWHGESESKERITENVQSISTQERPLLSAAHFAVLRKGGEDRSVDSYVFQAGRPWQGATGGDAVAKIQAVTGGLFQLSDRPPHVAFHTFMQEPERL